MRVAVDVRCMMDRPTGIGVYGAQCLERLLEAGHDVIAYSFGGQQPGADLSRLAPRLARFVHHPVPMRVMRQVWRSERGPLLERFCGSLDVVLATETTLPRAEAVLVSTLHDALYLRHPEWFPRYVRRSGPEILRDVAARADVVIHNSEYTRRTLAAAVPSLASRAVVVPPAVDVNPTWTGVGQDILFVGTREPRKGLGTVARALLRMPGACRLIVVGKAGWGALPGAEAISLLEQQGRLVMAGFVTPARLRRLRMSSALAVVPSLDEGFGLPLLEALAAGMPVVASDIPVFREVAAAGCAYAPPLEPDEWTSTMERLLNRPRERAELSHAALERAREFSPGRQASALLHAFERAREAA